MDTSGEEAATLAAAGVPGATGESLIDGDTGHLALPMLKKAEMLTHGLAFHIHRIAELPKCLTVFVTKPVEQPPAVWVGQCPEHLVVVHSNLLA